ncbi:hypothetical protein [Thermococcus sp. 21S9]|uniref:hypothetical protein n=1 Tax=Thermococcus sp. 21S9 TaxID=1638223 RepID=UPI00143C2094|nr:hypothetical protein [Thermococcus sp. 21S9]NJE53884.1 hypothetical protein [Thermococcus sp. 21S9]
MLREKTKQLTLFALVWFLCINWGLEIVIGMAFKCATGSWISKTAYVYLAKVWIINLLKLLAGILTLKWLGLNFRDLIRGKFGRKELSYSTAVVLLFLAVEIAYFGGNYFPQIIREFRYHLSISPNEWLAVLSFASEYVYYVIEILMVNLLYVGALKLGGKRPAVLLPTFLWGFAHVLNIIIVPPVQAFLLGVYMMLFALLTYGLALKTRSLKVPIFIWLATMAL